MKEIKTLSICNTEEAIDLYRLMIEEYKTIDTRLQKVAIDEKSMRNLLQSSFDLENYLFFLLYINNEAVGFINSSRVSTANEKDSWCIKAMYLLEKYRIFPNFELLVYKTEKEVMQKKVCSIVSTALPFDDRTNAFWNSLNYEIEGNTRSKEL
ncbi:MAG TPA: hypothetical protein VJ861_08310 [Treponemataceae bacterium]|nr:hypothetical protein [Treponemataceae bacterium]